MVQKSVNFLAPRRSTRLNLSIPVTITSLDTSVPFAERTDTVSVEAHGCGVRISGQIPLGSCVRVELINGYRSTTARVALVAPMAIQGSGQLVALAFDEPSNFWGIPNPPADWPRDLVTPSVKATTSHRSAAAAGADSGATSQPSGHTASSPQQETSTPTEQLGTQTDTDTCMHVWESPRREVSTPTEQLGTHADAPAHKAARPEVDTVECALPEAQDEAKTQAEILAGLNQIREAASKATETLHLTAESAHSTWMRDLDRELEQRADRLRNIVQVDAERCESSLGSIREELALTANVRQELQELAGRLEDKSKQLLLVQEQLQPGLANQGDEQRQLAEKLKTELREQLTSSVRAAVDQALAAREHHGPSHADVLNRLNALTQRFEKLSESNKIAQATLAEIGTTLTHKFEQHTASAIDELKHLLASRIENLSSAVQEQQHSNSANADITQLVDALTKRVKSLSEKNRSIEACVAELGPTLNGKIEALTASAIENIENHLASHSGNASVEHEARAGLQSDIADHRRQIDKLQQHLESQFGEVREELDGLRAVQQSVQTVSTAEKERTKALETRMEALIAETKQETRTLLDGLKNWFEHEARAGLQSDIADHRRQIDKLQQHLESQFGEVREELDGLRAVQQSVQTVSTAEKERTKALETRMEALIAEAKEESRTLLDELKNDEQELRRQLAKEQQGLTGVWVETTDCRKLVNDTTASVNELRSAMDAALNITKSAEESIRQVGNELNEKLHTSEEQMRAMVTEQQRASADVAQNQTEHEIWQREVKAELSALRQQADQLESERPNPTTLREELNKIIDGLPDVIQEQVKEKTGPAIAEAYNRLTQQIEWAQQEGERLSHNFDDTLRRRQTEVCAALEGRVEQLKKETQESLSYISAQLCGELQSRLRADVKQQQKDLKDGQLALKADTAELRKQSQQVAVQLAAAIRARESVDEAVRGLPATVEARLTEGAAVATNDFRSRMNAEITSVQQEFVALRSNVEEMLISRQNELMADVERRADQLVSQTGENIRAVGDKSSKALQLQLTAKATEIETALAQMQETSHCELSQLEANLRETLASVQDKTTFIENTAAFLAAGFRTQVEGYKDDALAQLRNQADRESSAITTEFAKARELAEQYLSVKEKEYVSHINTAMEEVVETTQNVLGRTKANAEESFDKTIAGHLKRHSDKLSDVQASLEKQLGKLETSGADVLNNLQDQFAARLQNTVAKVEKDVMAHLNHAVVTATAEQQNKVRELSDRILNETMGRVNGLAKGLLHVTTLARNETEKLNAERKSCTETLLNTTAALSEQIEGFKQVLHQNVAQATEQITKKSQLAVELVDEPLQRKVRECTQDLNGMIERSADELAERIAAIDRAVTQTCERKIAETSSSLRSNVDNLVQQATSRCQDAVREILGSLARPLQSDKRS